MNPALIANKKISAVTPDAKLNLDLQLLLPDLPDASDPCAGALIRKLSKNIGVTNARIVDAAASPIELCIQYAPDRISQEQVQKA